MKRGLRMHFFGRNFFASRIGQYTRVLRPTTCIQRATTCANANYQSWILSHGEKRARQDTGMYVQLEGQFRLLRYLPLLPDQRPTVLSRYKDFAR
jgi:hypothetical protein